MGTLFDQDGKPVDVPDAHVTQALVSGQYRTDKPAVDVRAGGKVFSVPTENLGKFVASQPGAQVMTDAESAAHAEEKRQAALQEKYGGLGSQAKVALASGASGLTLGASDLALGAVLSDAQKRDLEAAKAANPITNVTAGIAGALAPTLLTGGAAAPEEAALFGGRELAAVARTGEEASALAKGANVAREASTLERVGNIAKSTITAPTRALDSVSGAVERGVGSLVGTDADSFMGQLAQKAVAKAAGGMATGAGATGAMDIGENAISPDHQLTGEQILQHMGVGALLGGGLGALGGVGGAVLDRALAPAEAGAGGGLREGLEKRSAKWWWDATGAGAKENRALEASGLTTEEVGRWGRDELAAFTKDGAAPKTREAIATAAERAAEDAQPKIGGAIDALDTMGAKPSVAPIFDRIKTEVLTPLEQHIDPAAKTVLGRVGGLVDNAEAKLGDAPTFRELFDMRREVDNAIKFNKADPTQVTANAELRKVRAILEDEIGTQGATQAGDEWAQDYGDAKRQFRMAKSVSEAIESSDPRIAQRNKVGLSDTIVASHGLSGGIAAAAAGHPLALLAAAGAAVGHHVLKEYGDVIGSHVLNAIAKSGGIQNVIQPALAARIATDAQRNYNSTMVRALSALTLNETAPNPPGRPRSLDGDYEAKSKLVRTMLENPQAHVASLAANAKALGPTFSTTASSYQRASMAASLALKNALPVEKPINPESPKAGTIKPSDAAKAKFIRTFDAIEDPTNLLHAAGKGLLTRDMVDAVAFTKPAVLKDMQKRVTAELATLREPLDPPQAAAAKMILGEPIFDRPIAPLPQAQVTTAREGGPREHGGTRRPFKSSLSHDTGLVGTKPGVTT
jgi:hypothetical protein